LVRHRAGEKCLPGSGRSVEQHALRRIDSEAVEQLGVLEREFDELANLLDGTAESAYVVIGDVGPPRLLRFGVFGQELDLGVRGDLDDSSGERGYDEESDLLERERRLLEERSKDVLRLASGGGGGLCALVDRGR